MGLFSEASVTSVAETEKKMVEETLLYTFSIAMCMGLGALSIFVWAVLDNQMDDTEDIKYRILEREVNNGRGE